MYKDLPSAPELFVLLKDSVDVMSAASMQREEVIQLLRRVIISVRVKPQE